MITFTLQDRAGKAHKFAAKGEGTLMEAIRDNGFTDNYALCGGHCSCATCHVIIADEFLPGLGVMSEDEDALLDGSDHREAGSRLACQVALGSGMDGLSVRIAPIG